MRNLDRRAFLTSAALVAATLQPAPGAVKYKRYDVTSAEGKKMLVSYAKGIKAMLKVPPEHPHNWFRNAFVHFLDCPHGNWWFYVWHRGYIGYLEQTIRKLSHDRAFTLPFWDWSTLPQIPSDMFDGVLTPTSSAYLPYTRDIATFTKFIQPALKDYWNAQTKEQMADQAQRGVTTFDALWEGVTGGGVPGNSAFAATARARYLTAQNPNLDPATAFDCSRGVVLGGIGPTMFYASSPEDQALSFNSVRTESHSVQPGGSTWFSILEGMPHNNAHNYIGGVGPWDPGPHGNMANFLSPVDPIFFLHHANMDRLWDVWTRKQQALQLDYRPSVDDTPTFMNQRFRYFVDGNGLYLTDSKAGDYFSTEAFGYDYAPGTGEELIPRKGANVAVATPAPPRKTLQAVARGNIATVALPKITPETHLIAAVTVSRPENGGRSFDVFVNAPAGVTEVAPGSPFFAGRIAFFGPSTHHHGDATFMVPLLHAPTGGVPAVAAVAATGGTLNIMVVPSHGIGPAPSLRAISLQAF